MSKIVSIHSFRGGTGKSNSTANIAAIVARHGYRVGIVDTDIQSPGIHVLFGFNEKNIDYSLNDYLWGRCKIEDTAYDVTTVLQDKAKANSKIYLIPSSIKAGDIAKILREGFEFELLSNGFYDLSEALELDYLFIDTHPGLNEETLLSLTISDTLLIILRPDRQDFQGTAVTVEVARKLGVPELFLLVNKALQNFDFEALKQEVERTYKAPAVGILPHSEEMMQLQSSGIFSLRYPNHSLTRVMETVAQQIIG
ncbi:MAG: MinD/ParA family protein [Symploca sp. SIO2E6]|nr:MinD/ParA family protein [Symploca sp. SIO2E6]